MKRSTPDIALLAALVNVRASLREAIVLLAGRSDPTLERIRALLAGEASRLTAALKGRATGRTREAPHDADKLSGHSGQTVRGHVGGAQ